MKRLISAFAIVASLDAIACTSLIATAGATTDNSNFITYAADSHSLYGELYNYPSADYPAGSMRIVRE